MKEEQTKGQTNMKEKPANRFRTFAIALTAVFSLGIMFAIGVVLSCILLLFHLNYLRSQDELLVELIDLLERQNVIIDTICQESLETQLLALRKQDEIMTKYGIECVPRGQ